MEIDVVISGGSVEGICTATGFLKAVSGDLKHKIVSAAGNSAGGVVLGCHAAGMTPLEIEEMVLETDFSEFISVPAWWNPVGALRAFRRGWLSDGKDYLEFLRDLAQGARLRDLSIDLHLTGSDYTNYRLVDLSAKSDPDMELALAMRITSSIPGGFKPVVYGGRVWYDGGVRRHYPVDLVPESDRPLYGWLLGSLSRGTSEPVETRPGLLGVLSDFVDQSVDNNVQDSMLAAKRKPVTISYDDAYVGTFDFGIRRDEKARLIEASRRMTLSAIDGGAM